MATTITDNLITSDTTTHRACRDALEPAWWWVTWLPTGQVCDRNQAITAITIAEAVAAGVKPGHQDWPLLRDLAAELGLSGKQALKLAGAR